MEMKHETPPRRKGVLDILSLLTPLILGIGVTGVGACFIENVGSKARMPPQLQVRYYHDEDKDAAEAIVDILHGSGIIPALALRLTGLVARAGTLEVWLSASE
jgi:hypothetical protein